MSISEKYYRIQDLIDKKLSSSSRNRSDIELIAVSKKAAVHAKVDGNFCNGIIATFSAYKLNFLVYLELYEPLVQNHLMTLTYSLDQKHIDHISGRIELYIQSNHVP